MIKKLLWGLALLSFSTLSFAEPEPPMPSGTVQAQVEGKTINFPLLNAFYHVDVQGDIATVQLKQTFTNPSTVALNAEYLFPLNQDSAVYAMQMRVNNEIIEAQIHRTEEAKQQFEQAKSEGKAAAMLEQQRPNMFTQKLANLMPNKPIEITLNYTQHVPRVDGKYELVLPLVVGPRYQPSDAMKGAPSPQATPNSQAPAGQWELQTLPQYPNVMGLDLPKSLESERVSIAVQLHGGMPIQAVDSQTHKLKIESPDANTRLITLDKGKTIDNHDFVLTYSLAGSAVQAGLLSHSDQRGNFFSLLLEPPAMPTAAQINPREMVFVLDTSGSMDGEPLAASKAFMRQALKQLRQMDSFRIIDFSDSPREFSAQPLMATVENIEQGLKHVEGLAAGGGTEIDAAVHQAFAPTLAPNVLRLVVFLTDGYIGDEANVLSTINAERGTARIYALGVGSSVNRYLLDEMGRAGRGFARYIDPTQSSSEVAVQLANRLETPVLTDITIDWGDTQAQNITPSTLPDLFAGDSL